MTVLPEGERCEREQGNGNVGRPSGSSAAPLAPFDIEHFPVVLFDFDGTLADTGPAVMRTARAVLRSYNIEPAEGDLRKMLGPPLTTGFRDVFGLSEAEAEACTAEYRARFAREVKPCDFPPLPGVPELLRALRAQGRRLAVATSRKHESASEMIDSLGWTLLFDAIMGMHEPERMTKSDSIRAALLALNARPEEAVMVGDRFHDVEGAHEVGVACIGVYTGAALPGEHDAAEASCSSMVEVAKLLGL